MAEVRKYFTGKLGLEVPDDARLIVVDERPGAMWLYPISWALGLAAALVSLFFLWKSTRPRLVDDDVSSAAEGA
jgi:hypothetical protein